jgi:hypothetical protein
LETLIDIGLIAIGTVLIAFSGRVALAMNQAFYGEAVVPFREFMFRMVILVMGALLVIAGAQDLRLPG